MGKSEISKDGKLPAHGPKGEGVDPLTTGQASHGEDVKAASKKVQVSKATTSNARDRLAAAEARQRRVSDSK